MEFINTQIGSAVAKYAGVLDETNLSALSSAKEELLLAINKKTVITGNENKFEDRIAILNAECNELALKLTATQLLRKKLFIDYPLLKNNHRF